MSRPRTCGDGRQGRAGGLPKPTTTVELSVEGGAKQTIRFGAETAAKDGVYVKGTVQRLIASGLLDRKRTMQTWFTFANKF